MTSSHTYYKWLTSTGYNRTHTQSWLEFWRDEFGDYQSKKTNSTTTTLNLFSEEVISFVASQTGLRYSVIHLSNDSPLLTLIHLKFKHFKPLGKLF